MADSSPTTNGDVPQSLTLNHLTSYPIISTGISTFSSHPYGAKSLELVQSAYSSFNSNLYPRIHPYLVTPYSYVKPYLAKADNFGDSTLSSIDARFPIVRSEPSSIQESLQSTANYPFALAGQGKEYVLTTWNEEYGKTEGKDGVIKATKAVIGTQIKLGSDVVKQVFGVLEKVRGKGEEIVEKAKEKNGGAN